MSTPYAAFHWSRDLVITSSRAVKQRSTHLVQSWSRELVITSGELELIGFVHLEFTARN